MSEPGEPIVQLTENGVEGFEVLCRICANSSDHLVAIYSEEGVSNGLADKMNRYLPAKVQQTDLLPLQCCYQCASTVLTWHELVVGSVEADRRFRDIQDEIERQLAGYQDAETGPTQNGVVTKTVDSETEACAVPVCLFSDMDMRQFVAQINRHSPERPVLPVAMPGDQCFTKAVTAPKESATHGTKVARQRPASVESSRIRLQRELAMIREEQIRENERRSKASERAASLVTSGGPSEARGTAAAAAAGGTAASRAPFHCTVCGKHFVKKVSLQYHMCVHRDEGLFACDLCDKRLRSRSTLKRHVDHVHRRIKNFACDICGRAFASATTRNDHRRTHTREQPLMCESCGKGFGSMSALRAHALFHTDTLAYRCDVCPRKFRRKHELMYHSYTHTGAWPYVCKTCGQRYPRQSQLTVHQFRHSDTRRPYVPRRRGCENGADDR